MKYGKIIKLDLNEYGSIQTYSRFIEYINTQHQFEFNVKYEGIPCRINLNRELVLQETMDDECIGWCLFTSGTFYGNTDDEPTTVTDSPSLVLRPANLELEITKESVPKFLKV